MLPPPNHSPEPPTLPIRDLKQFLEEIRKLFDNVVYHWDYILFEEEFRPRSKAAWEELRPIFEDWQEQVSTTYSPKVWEGVFSEVGILRRGA